MAIPAAVAYFGGKAVDNATQGPPPAQDYMGIVREQGRIQQDLLNQQTRANRPNQSTPFASTSWVQGPNGQWTQQTSLNGGLGEASTALQAQLAESMRRPLDFSGLPQVGTGESARQQAIDAALGQARSRLDPMLGQREESLRTRLLNQGLAEGSEAFNKAMDRFGQERNDAYNQALFSAIGQGTQAGQALFNQNMQQRQQMLSELLRQRNQPLAELAQLQGFTAMPGFSQAGMAQAPNLLGAARMQDAANFQQYQARQQMLMDLLGAGTDLLGTGATLAAASDERVKMNIERLPVEAYPGVPTAIFRYKPGQGPEGLFAGVVAQDLQPHRPDAVQEGPNGVLYVTSEFAPTKIGD